MNFKDVKDMCKHRKNCVGCNCIIFNGECQFTYEPKFWSDDFIKNMDKEYKKDNGGNING